MTTYIIADTHFSDANILKFENRPFSSVYSMNYAIIDSWNRTVEEDDEVYILGDFGDFSKVNKLSGIKYLVKGNHDTLSNEELRECGFSEVYDKPIILDDFFILSHEPMYVTENAPYANIFGHVHDNPMYKTVSSRSYCVSVERIDYTPISFDEVKEAIRKENE